MAGIALSITGRSRTSRENCSIQITASVSLSILRFGEEKVRERGICWLSMVSLSSVPILGNIEQNCL